MNIQNWSRLAGLWEGEGSICIFQNKRKTGTQKLSVTLTLVNTDATLIREASRILAEEGLKFHLWQRPQSNPKWKSAYQLTLRHFGNIKVFLEKIIPFMRGNKKSIGILTLQFVNSRLRAMEKNRNSPNSETEKMIFQRVKRMNVKGQVESSEAIRLTPDGEDMVRTAVKVAE